MEPYRSLALLAGSLGLISCLIAVSTDFWFVALGPNLSAHSGLWPRGSQDPVAALWGLVSVGFLVLSYIPALSAPGRGPLLSTITAFASALSLIVAMAVYTSERWDQHPHPQIQTFFSWSFYLGWVSAILWLCTGSLSLATHCSAPRPGYEAM
ncbi:protein NKG7 isoform X2 [Dipodomys merriami]|uniref:protein NKG7 isoform X2 n=1 Tax=Dipodomys merriami TaxID=94247 RepID=UPI003855CE5C